MARIRKLEGAARRAERALDEYKLTKNDMEVVRIAVAAVRGRPRSFADAGKLLDRSYSTAALRVKRPRRGRTLGSDLSGDERGDPDAGWSSDPGHQGPRIVLAVDDLLAQPEPFVDGQARAAIVLTWLLYDEAAQRVRPRVTELQGIAWDKGRRVAAALVVRLRLRARPWFRLLRRAVAQLGLGGGDAMVGGRGRRKKVWLDDAMTMVNAHPGRNNRQIAIAVGISPSTLCRSKTYRLAAAIARQPRVGPRRGFVSTDSEGRRSVDALEEADCEDG